MEAEMDTPQNRYKIYNFTLTASSISAMVSVVQGDRGRRLSLVCSIKFVVCNFHRKASNDCLFNFC